jgi:hypothetical protein
MGKYKVWITNHDTLKTESVNEYDLTAADAKKLFTSLKKKYKGKLLTMGQFRDGAYRGFLRN